MKPHDRDPLSVVEQSPAAAASHDRAGWIGLFTPHGRIEDPVGTRPHVGYRQIERFYDTFIGPRDVVFHRDLDIVSGSTVIRDLDLEVSLLPSLSMTIPAVLRYDLDLTPDVPQIAALRAYWDLPAMMAQFLRLGTAAGPAATALAYGLLRHQKISGALGFARGFRNAGRRGKTVATSFAAHLAAGRTSAADKLLHGTITAGDGKVMTTDELADRLRGAIATRVIASGHIVVVSTRSPRGRAVLFAEITRRRSAINSVNVFTAQRLVQRH